MSGAPSIPGQARGLARMIRPRARGAACGTGSARRPEGEPGSPGHVTIFDFLDDLVDRVSDLFRDSPPDPAEPGPDHGVASGWTAAGYDEGDPDER